VARGALKGDLTMTRQKDLKQLVRARMKKTGEAYTTARAQILRKPGTKAAPAQAVAQPIDYAALAGMADESIKAKTGRTWEQWTRELDKHKAFELAHGEIAVLVKAEYDTADWWTQTVTVGYERIKGLRARGQRRDGTYEASKSRTFNVPVEVLFNAWADANKRRRWLDEPGVKVRTATAPKSIRLGWSDGSIIAVGFMSKGKDKSSVAVQHAKLSSRSVAEELKKYWAERLDELGQILRSVSLF
jgi:hypothetical protein